MANISIPRRSSAIVNKPQAYRLLTLLQMVQTHHSAARLSVGVSSQQLKDLGTDLLGILAASINYENAEVGDALEEIRQREKEKKLAALFGGKEKAKLPLTTEKIPNLPPSLQFLNKELMSPERCYEYLSGGLPF